jgi:hypothetical protein
LGSSDFGAILSRIDIWRAVRPDERYSAVLDVRPCGEILLRLAGCGARFLSSFPEFQRRERKGQ